MPKYTYKDVIIDPTSEAARNCVGKMAYYSDNPNGCLSSANNSNGTHCGILRGIEAGKRCPFVLESSVHTWACIIPKKEELKPGWVPFESREEFLDYYTDHDERLTGSSIGARMSTFRGIFLKDSDNDIYYMVTAISKYGVIVGDSHLATTWRDLLDGYTFLDGMPCGKLKEEPNG